VKALGEDQREFLRDLSVKEGERATAEDSARASFAGIHRSFPNVRGLAATDPFGKCKQWNRYAPRS
jgi:phosphoenolpyruvate synthase/pyruvate phosphate dikinase